MGVNIFYTFVDEACKVMCNLVTEVFGSWGGGLPPTPRVDTPLIYKYIN